MGAGAAGDLSIRTGQRREINKKNYYAYPYQFKRLIDKPQTVTRSWRGMDLE
jgi:hypothetical protein